jgi:hypothetical protein
LQQAVCFFGAFLVVGRHVVVNLFGVALQLLGQCFPVVQDEYVSDGFVLLCCHLKCRLYGFRCFKKFRLCNVISKPLLLSVEIIFIEFVSGEVEA